MRQVVDYPSLFHSALAEATGIEFLGDRGVVVRGRLLQAVSAFARECLGEIEWSSDKEYLHAAAEELGVLAIKDTTTGYEGYLEPKGDKHYFVYLNPFSQSARKRFTLAHELGHILLHKLVPESRSAATRDVLMPIGSRGEEKLCDLFAAELLMPFDCVREAISRSMSRGISAAVLEVQKWFGASLAASAMRVGEVSDYDPAVMLVTRDSVSPSKFEVRGSLRRSLVCDWTSKALQPRGAAGRRGNVRVNPGRQDLEILRKSEFAFEGWVSSSFSNLKYLRKIDFCSHRLLSEGVLAISRSESY